MKNKSNLLFLGLMLLGTVSCGNNTTSVKVNGVDLANFDIVYSSDATSHEQTLAEKVKQAIKEDQAITITVDYPAFAFKLIRNGYDVSPKLLGKTISFKAAENTISSIISKLNNSNISVFDMTTTLKGIKELIK